MRYVILLALTSVLSPLLGGCDTAGSSLTLLPTYEVRESFVFPRDSLVTLPTGTFPLTFQFDGALIWFVDPLADTSEEPLALASFVQAEGFEPGAVRRVEAAGPLSLLHGGPPTDDLSYIEEITLNLTADGVPDHEVARGGPYASTPAAPLYPSTGEIPPAFATAANVRGRVEINGSRPGQNAIYWLRVLLPLRVVVDAAPPLGAHERLVGGSSNVRSFIQVHGHEHTAVAAAIVRRVSVTPRSETEAAFVDHVTRAVVRLRAAGDRGDGVQLAEVQSFDRPVTLSRDVAAVVRETGHVELLVDLYLNDGGVDEEGALSFTATAEMDIEVR